MTKIYLAALLAVFIGLGFTTQASAFDKNDFVWMADCQTKTSTYICWAATEPTTYGEIAQSAFNAGHTWEWFLKVNNLPADTKKTDKAPIMAMYAFMERSAANPFAMR